MEVYRPKKLALPVMSEDIHKTLLIYSRTSIIWASINRASQEEVPVRKVLPADALNCAKTLL
jgi:hypothetical protein